MLGMGASEVRMSVGCGEGDGEALVLEKQLLCCRS